MSNRALVSFFLSAFGVFASPSDPTSVADKTPASSAGVSSEQRQVLDRARAVNDDTYATLKSFVCREEMQRYKGDLPGSKKRSVDHVFANLSFENGVEHYSNIHQNDRTRATMSDISGAWSEGEFGTLLQQTAKLLEIQSVTFVSFVALGDVPAAVYRFDVAEKESPWDLEVGSEHFQIPFTTDVWISVATGEILKIARKSLSIPAETHISEIDWNVSLAAVDLNGKTWLLPCEAAYAVSYVESKRREWNQMSFSDYHRYGAESALKFDGF